MASASESQIPAGWWVTATRVPSKPYAGSRMTLIFFPMFFSSMWNMESGNSGSGMGFAKPYNWCSVDKTIAPKLGSRCMANLVGLSFLVHCCLTVLWRIRIS